MHLCHECCVVLCTSIAARFSMPKGWGAKHSRDQAFAKESLALDRSVLWEACMAPDCLARHVCSLGGGLCFLELAERNTVYSSSSSWMGRQRLRKVWWLTELVATYLLATLPHKPCMRALVSCCA